MPPVRRQSRSVPVVILHGWQDSEPGHWQRWLESELRAAEREVRFPTLGDPDVPVLADWLASMRAAIADLPADGFDVVAHSLSAVLWLHHAADPGDTPRPARVALVAPPSPTCAIPEIAAFFPPPLDIDAVRRAADGTVLVGGEDDSYTPEGITAAYGLPLKIATTVVPGGGHLNVSSGYGEWPAMLDWCRRDNLAFF
jgi:predicted alpha/beta hydrolase family esterase